MNSRFPVTASLRELVETMQDDLVSCVHAPHGLDIAVTGSLALDASDAADAPADYEMNAGILLLVGARGDRAVAAIPDLLKRMPQCLFLKLEDVDTSTLHAINVPVIGIAAEARWSQVISAVDRFIRDASDRERQAIGTGAEFSEHNDLFGLAKAVGDMTNTLVSIEDVQGRALAFSPYSDQADEIRRLSILGREAPPQHMAEMRATRVYDRLRRPGTVVGVDQSGDFRQRLGVGMHDPSSGEYLGTIWAQETDLAFSADAEEQLRAASIFAARLVGQTRLVHTMGTELVQRLLGHDGPSAGHGFAQQLSLEAPQTFSVVALETVGEGGSQQWLSSTEAVAIVTVQAAGFVAEAMVAPLGARLYAILPGQPDLRRVEQWTRRTVTTLARHRSEEFRAAMSSSTSNGSVSAARAETDRVLESVPYTADRPVVTLAELRTAVLLQEALHALEPQDLVRDDRFAALVAYDKAHSTDLVETARKYLEFFGDIGATSRALLTHSNTIRYRLGRIEKLSGYRLNDADDRLMLDLLIRLSSRG